MRVLVNIDVDDLPRAAKFYAECFGLAIGRRFGAGGVLRFTERGYDAIATA